MKKILTLIITAALLVNCNKEVKTEYTINGKAEGVYNGIRVYLNAIDFKTRKEQVLDTAIVMNEKFYFTGKLEDPEFRVLTIDNINGKLPFLLENETIQISIDNTTLTSSIISGSNIHDDYKNFEGKLFNFGEKRNKLTSKYREAARNMNNTLEDSLTNLLNKLNKTIREYPLEFAKANNDKYLSVILIDQEVSKNVYNIEALKLAFDNLDMDLKDTQGGKKLKTKIEVRYKGFLREKNLQIGGKAPNFEAPNPKGEMVNLDEIKGKVTIIDFWAAWCGPCRRENPNVVRIYNQYHDQGLEIIGVSLDGQSRQGNPKKAWLDAIEKDQLTWTHVSNLKYFSDPVAKLYNIRSIPATYVLDENGNIMAKNLRGKALELKVKELLNK